MTNSTANSAVFAKDRELIQARVEDYEFIRLLRNDSIISQGFIVQASITQEQQRVYMEKHGKNYYVALDKGVAAGFIGVVDRDLRLAVSKRYQREGIATFMLHEFQKICPDFDVCIKEDNHASRQFFGKQNFVEAARSKRNGTTVVTMTRL